MSDSATPPAEEPRTGYTPAERLAIALGTASPEELGGPSVNLSESDPETSENP